MPLVVAGVRELDAFDALFFALLEEQRVHDRLPPLLQVDQPLAVDLLLQIHGLPRASEALTRDDGLALRDVRRFERPPGESIIRGIFPG